MALRHPGTEQRLRERLRRTGAGSCVDVRVARSAASRRAWYSPLALVYVDGGHDYPTARDDLASADHLPAGGRLLMHDAFSSVGVTLALLLHVLPGRRLAYEQAHGLPRGPRTQATLAARPGADPHRAALVRAQHRGQGAAPGPAARAARLLGHDEPNDPYGPFCRVNCPKVAAVEVHRRARRGWWARGVIAVAMAVTNISTYGFTILAARSLGPQEYGALAALMGGAASFVNVASLGLQATRRPPRGFGRPWRRLMPSSRTSGRDVQVCGVRRRGLPPRRSPDRPRAPVGQLAGRRLWWPLPACR